MSDENGDGTTGGGLRAQLEAALAQNKELTTRLDSYEKSQRASTIRDVLAAKGAKPGTEVFYPDSADATETAIEKWLNDNATLFKASEQVQVPQTTDAFGSRPDAANQRANQARLLQANDLSNTPRSAGDLSDIGEALARATTRAELDQVYADYQFVNTTTN